MRISDWSSDVCSSDLTGALNVAEPETSLHDPDYLTEVPFDPEKLQFGFTMSGDPTIAPERVFSDGVFTFFDWGSRWNATDLPAVWRVVDGKSGRGSGWERGWRYV